MDMIPTYRLQIGPEPGIGDVWYTDEDRRDALAEAQELHKRHPEYQLFVRWRTPWEAVRPGHVPVPPTCTSAAP